MTAATMMSDAWLLLLSQVNCCNFAAARRDDANLIHVNVRTARLPHIGRRQNKSGKTMKHIAALTLAALMASTAAPALAQEKGDFLLGLGLGWVEPTQNSDTAAGQIDVDGNLRPTVTIEYFIADRIGVELLASWPFEHDANLQGAGNVAEVKQLPPTLSLQYHFVNASRITPFVGLGVNYTYFFDETGKGVLAGDNIDMDDSWGVALHAGIDYAIAEKSALRADVRYIKIESDTSINGAGIGEIEIDPWVFNIAYVMKF
jgi:outer membrane protein